PISRTRKILTSKNHRTRCEPMRFGSTRVFSVISCLQFRQRAGLVKRNSTAPSGKLRPGSSRKEREHRRRGDEGSVDTSTRTKAGSRTRRFVGVPVLRKCGGDIREYPAPELYVDGPSVATLRIM